VRDPDEFAVDLDQVVIAERIERIAAIVAGRGHGDAGGDKLVHRATPRRLGVRPRAVLQIKVTHRQRDDGDARLAAQRRGLPNTASDWVERLQQWPQVTLPAKRLRIAASATWRRVMASGSRLSST